ncbi:MAG: DUF488 domain-containing protein [Armatimonadota bacterium]
MTDGALTIYTIGHSNVTVEDFTGLLAARGIRILLDVRSAPYSQYASQFNKEALQDHPAIRPFHYRYAGQLLGGKPDNPAFLDEEGHIRYDLLAASPAFREGIEKLLALARQAPTAVMCSEEDPTECHRRLLIGRVLAEQDVTVLHMRADGRLQTEADLQAEETGGQLALGLGSVEEKPWKSTRSVLPKKTPPGSSDY